jgi:IS1 family transposase
MMFSMNKLSTADRARVVRCIVEGNSLRATARMTGVARNTVAKLLLELGEVCRAFQDRTIRNLWKTTRVECDEIWSFCYAKAKNVPEEKKGQFGYGDVWTWTALDADSKLIVSWLVGPRVAECARELMRDVERRVPGRMQLTTDGLSFYRDAVAEAFGDKVDFAQLVKKYGNLPAEKMGESRYSPAVCLGCEKTTVIGHPDEEKVSTSYVERSNLTIRMCSRRYTRLTNGFSKKIEYHMAAFSLFTMHYNFARKHMTTKATPAEVAGIADHVWTIEEIVGLLDQPSN